MTHVTSADASRQQTQGTGEACKTVDAMSDITPSEQRNRGTDNTCGVENKSVIENGNVLENKTVNIIYQQQDAIPLTEIAKEQENCKEIQSLKANSGHSLKLAEIAIDNMGGVILCDVSLEHKKARPIIPKILRRRIFDKIHDLCHPGIKSTNNLISERYVWPQMHADITNYVKSCLKCQKNRIFRHTVSQLSSIPIPNERFSEVQIDIVGPFVPSKEFTSPTTKDILWKKENQPKTRYGRTVRPPDRYGQAETEV
ncbi:uncharacterized protein LOC144426511 isoform X1 [Styela clava]